MIIWPVEEMGRNSVIPSITARIIACINVIMLVVALVAFKGY